MGYQPEAGGADSLSGQVGTVVPQLLALVLPSLVVGVWLSRCSEAYWHSLWVGFYSAFLAFPVLQRV